MKYLDFYCVLLIFLVNICLKDNKGIKGTKIQRYKGTIINAFQKILKESNRKPNKIWIEKGVNFTIVLLKNC